MTSVLAKSILESAIAVGDWVLSCLQIRNPSRYDEIFDKLYSYFRESRAESDIYFLFLTVLDDVFDILKEGQIKGSIKAGTVALDGNPEHKIEVEKLYHELLREAEDFFVFLFIFANTLDTTPQKTENAYGYSTYNIIKTLADVPENEENSNTLFCDFRLRMMMSGFNVIPKESPYRHQACLILVRFAASHGLFERLLPYLDDIKEWFSKDPFISSATKRQIYAMIISQLEKQEEKKLAYSFIDLVVSEFDKECPTSELNEATEASVRLLLTAIKIEDVFSFRPLVESRTVQKLQCGNHAPLLQLALIYSNGDHRDFLEFHKQHPDIFATYGLEYDSCLKKIQLLVLASLAFSCTVSCYGTHSKTPRLSIDDVVKRLEISHSEAEILAIRAISLGLISGRIDQIHSEIAIRSAFQRVFGPTEWIQLAQRLVHLNDTITEVLSVLENA